MGEGPVIFGTPYQGSHRATEPSRVIHISGVAVPRGWPRILRAVN